MVHSAIICFIGGDFFFEDMRLGIWLLVASESVSVLSLFLFILSLGGSGGGGGGEVVPRVKGSSPLLSFPFPILLDYFYRHHLMGHLLQDSESVLNISNKL